MTQNNQLFVIERMQAHHLPALAALERDCFSQPWSADGFRSELANPTADFLLAVMPVEGGGDYPQGYGIYRDEMLTGMLFGYVGMHSVLDEGEIANLAVSPFARRTGVARELLSALYTAAKERGVLSITLEVRESNHAAIALYEGEGFVPVGKRKNFYTRPLEDALLMTKEIKGEHG